MRTGQDMVVLCKGCSSKVRVSEMRYHHGHGDFVCPNCFTGLAKKQKEVIKPVELPNTKERVHYRCTSCGYNFVRSKGFQFGGYCFFCGKQTVELIEDKGAKLIKPIEDNELLKDSQEL